MEVESSNPVEPSTAAELSALVDQAQNGDAGALPRINQILDECPEIWKHLGDIGGLAERARCTCNDELLEASFALPETGPIGLEGDRGQMEYRHIQIKMP